VDLTGSCAVPAQSTVKRFTGEGNRESKLSILMLLSWEYWKYL